MCQFASAEDPRGRSALIAAATLTQHHFKSQRRYAAIQRHEAELAGIRQDNIKLQGEVHRLKKQLLSWERWWAGDYMRVSFMLRGEDGPEQEHGQASDVQMGEAATSRDDAGEHTGADTSNKNQSDCVVSDVVVSRVEDLTDETCTSVDKEVSAAACANSSSGDSPQEPTSSEPLAAARAHVQSEIRSLHNDIMEVKKEMSFEDDAFRKIVAQSAALIGKSRRLVPDLSRHQVHACIADLRMTYRGLLSDLKAFLKDWLYSQLMADSEAEPSAMRTRSSAICSLAARLGIYQRTRAAPPTTKTKRPKAKHKRGK